MILVWPSRPVQTLNPLENPLQPEVVTLPKNFTVLSLLLSCVFICSTLFFMYICVLVLDPLLHCKSFEDKGQDETHLARVNPT